MGAIYSLLGLVVGVALNEVVRWRIGGVGKRPETQGLGPRRPPTAQPANGGQVPHCSRRFTAQDYYDR